MVKLATGRKYVKGDQHAILHQATSGEQIAMDYLTAIGEKRYTDYTLWTKFSFNTSINTDATDIFRIEELYRISCGGVCAAGTVTMGDVPAGVPVYAQINQYRGQFTRCLHYVAPGNIGIFPSIVASARTSGGVTFIIIADQDFSSIGGMSRIPIGVDELELSSGGSSYVRMDPPLAVDNRDGTTGMGIGVVCAAVSAAGQDGSAAFTVYEYTPDY